MTIPAKATLAWLLLFVVMFANGAIRVLILQPQLGEALARQAASLSGVALVLVVSWLFVRVSPQARPFAAASGRLFRSACAWARGSGAPSALSGDARVG